VLPGKLSEVWWVQAWLSRWMTLARARSISGFAAGGFFQTTFMRGKEITLLNQRKK